MVLLKLLVLRTKKKLFMQAYRYTFEKGSKKHLCPECRKKRFVRYIDVETQQYIPINYGRCDREMKCGYHLNPYKNGYAKDNTIENDIVYQISKPIKKPPSLDGGFVVLNFLLNRCIYWASKLVAC